ncbi:maleylpyruvate isomerase family mycothiol-dependent enzyme [Streptomyces avicenniae]|uniref:maleylpyruvate isomerase family mycothiol-dependent enzyme n=1 Tax=Streptomyces avicenniae TaxID=500153 RepID=UPI00069BFE30|nr:maleylpyruvate isomerase family mycothiol-dependent enzyme [Streptomyces avicenniae]
MTGNRPDPHADLTALAAATDALVADASALGPADAAAPSRLPGWTRGHLLAHLARNADALVNVLEGRPMYPDDEARSAAIARDAGRPLAVHLTDLRESADRFAAAAARLDAARWDTTATFRGGVTGPMAAVPLRRWVEVELHHVDLDVGRTVAQLGPAFLGPAPGYLADRYLDHPDVPPLDLRADDGRRWRTGTPAAPGTAAPTVTGPAAALVGWLSGRTTGTGLTTPAPLPTLPPL